MDETEARIARLEARLKRFEELFGWANAPLLCENCGKTIAEHTPLMHCRATADRGGEPHGN